MVGLLTIVALSAIGCQQRVPDGAQQLPLSTDPPTGSDSGCPAQEGGGPLVRYDPTGFAFGNRTITEPVIWPYGYSAAIVDGYAVLVDPAGNIVAVEGDQVRAEGWLDGFTFHACADVHLL
jgi:hypothetical protein